MADFENDVPLESEKSAKTANPVVRVAIIAAGEQSEAPDSVALKRLFQIALETRNFEIAQLVQRNNFFMIFQGVLLAGVMQSSHLKPVVSFLVCLAGMLVSFYQVQMASGAKFWQEYWEAALHKVEIKLLKNLAAPHTRREELFHLFHEDGTTYSDMVGRHLGFKGVGITRALIMRRFSVSRVPIYVAIALTLVWALLLLCTMRGYPPLSVPSFVVGF